MVQNKQNTLGTDVPKKRDPDEWIELNIDSRHKTRVQKIWSLLVQQIKLHSTFVNFLIQKSSFIAKF